MNDQFAYGVAVSLPGYYDVINSDRTKVPSIGSAVITVTKPAAKDIWQCFRDVELSHHVYDWGLISERTRNRSKKHWSYTLGILMITLFIFLLIVFAAAVHSIEKVR